ncbi:MAG: hypothetical protein IID44_02160 [Planctomycetes bacterium]|nr:hypothetical protein [Planctomycetota bacterium]
MTRSIHAVTSLSGMMSSVVISLIVAATSSLAAAEPLDKGFVDKVYRDAAGQHKYVVFVPRDYTPERKWPIILYLHGASARGTDGRLQTAVGLGSYVKSHAKSFPFLVVFPQCENVTGRILTGWSPESIDGRRALAILDEVEQQFSVDKNHEILTGWSKGGYGAWSLAAATPRRWAAVVPLAGGGDPKWADKLKDVPVWAFQGANDLAVRPSQSRRMIEAIKAVGGKPRYTEAPDVAHEIWKVAYRDELFSWMLNPSAAATTGNPSRVQPGPRRPVISAAETDGPFVPAVIVPQAVYVRMGNEMLKTLADSIPKIIPRDVLRGRLDDYSDETTAQGRTYRVEFTHITYDGQLSAARIEALGKDRLNVRLGLENAIITIGKTFVSSEHRSATAGPIRIVLGHRRPVWLDIDLTPFVEHHKLRLKITDAKFNIPDDNWYVTSPASVSTHRLGLMGGLRSTRGLRVVRNKVSSGLVSGIYGSKSKIESQVLTVVPALIKHLEEKLELTDVTELVGGVWPLPVYKPRLQLWPEAVATDQRGMSIVFAMAAAAADPRHAPATPRLAEPAGIALGQVPQVLSLQVGVAPNVLKPLTDLLVQAGVGRIHLLDIPGGAFEPMTTFRTLAEAIPDLKRYGTDVEIRAELVLASPLNVVDASNSTNPSGGDAAMFQFQFPKMIVSYAIKADPSSSKWTPYVDFEIQLIQKARAKLLKPSHLKRTLRMDWIGDADIKVSGRFAPGYKPIDPELDVQRIGRLFEQGWRDWTQSGPLSQFTVPDVDFGFTKLRLSDVGWAAPHIYATFSAPGIKLTNLSDQDLIYETQGPGSVWGGPHTLKPGKSHKYDVAQPILYRRRTSTAAELYTLPVGSHSIFHRPTAGGPPQLFQADSHGR